MTEQQINQSNQHFESWSRDYERSYMQWLIFDRVHRLVLEAVPAGLQPESILDVGCGTGRLLRRAAGRWPSARLSGVDLAVGMISQARRLTPGARFYVSQAETLPLPGASFDLVLSTVSFHHWANQAQGVRQVARVLRPGGVFVLSDTIVPYWLWRVIRHGQYTSPEGQRAMFKGAGLSVLSQQRKLTRHFLVTVGRKE